MQFPTYLTIVIVALFALITDAAPILEARVAPGAPYGKGTFQLIGIAAGEPYQYGGYWIQASSLGNEQNNAILTRNQSFANAFSAFPPYEYNGKTQDIYYNTKSNKTTIPYSMVLLNTPLNNGPTGYNYVGINSGLAKSNMTFDPDFVYLVPPSERILAVCYEVVGDNPGLGLLWREGNSTASSSCMDVNLRAIFNH